MKAVTAILMLLFWSSSVHCNSISLSSFIPHDGLTQTDTNLHAIIELSTDQSNAECANYCVMRGGLFRENECGAFFVKDDKLCHLVPKSYKDATTEISTDTTYYKKI